MKKLFFFILLLIPMLGFTQSSYLKYIEKGKFSKAEKKIEKSLSKKPGDVELIYYKSRLYMEPKFNKYDTKESYSLLLDSRTSFRKITDEKELKSFNKIPLDNTVYNNYIDTICIRALDDANLINSEDDYQDYLNFYSLMPNKCNVTATQNRNKVAYENACKVNTPEAFQLFMRKYPNADQYKLAKNKRNALEYEIAKAIDDIESYNSFIKKYPDANEVQSAWNRIHEIAFEDAKRINSSKSYKCFINEYPKSKQYQEAYSLMEDRQYDEIIVPGDWASYYLFVSVFPQNRLKSVAQDSIYELACLNHKFGALKYCVENLSGERRNKTLLMFHDVYTNDGEKFTVDLFYKSYDDPILKDIKIKDYSMVNAGDELFLHLPYDYKLYKKYDEYIKLAAPNERSFVALQRLISNDIKNKNWYNALNTVKKYQLYFGNDNAQVLDLINLLETKWDYTIKISSIGNQVNTKNGGELSPVVSADDKALYFCGKNRSDNIGGEDIFKAERKNGYWTDVELVKGLSSAESNDAPLSVSSDGNTILLFKSGKIYFSNKTAYGWTSARVFADNINSADWQSDAMFTSDGKTLIFTSTGLPGENIYIVNPYNYHGDNIHPSDIYVSHLNDFGMWSNPMNIGDVINTPYSERTPFIHPDMKTLYFSSDGHGGVGKLDVFKSTRLSDTCWDCWSEPINMGKEFNTYDNDMGYKISTSGDVAYFSYEQKSTQQSSVLLLLDVSGSMDGDKLEALQIAAVQTCQNAIINNSEVAILAFAGNCKEPIASKLEFTKDINDVILNIAYLNAGGGTPMYESYAAACEYMWKNSSRQSTNKVIILMTDGDANGCTTLDKTVNNLKYRGLLYRTQCIAFDVNKYGYAAQDLEKIATSSKGQFYLAESVSDLGMTFEKAGSDIFNISKSDGNTDIMVCNLPNHLKPDYVATIAGTLVDKDNQPVYADIRWEDLETGKNVGQSKSDPVDGSFFIILPLGKIYGYYVDTDDYFPISNNIDLRDSTSAVVINENIDLVSFKQMIDDGTAVPVNNLFFSVAKSSLLPSSIPELKRVAEIIKTNGLKVEISGHTDSDGEEVDNQTLSEKRANAVKNFLINEGCDANNIITIGFGESKPIMSNDTEKGKAKNRRVELKFVK
ncbi:MAG: OmpA family protein [Bacteroidales bacterium]|nr:OmpA family protein [Bacteroidales bacterium]